jgi:hypothetical protein
LNGWNSKLPAPAAKGKTSTASVWTKFSLSFQILLQSDSAGGKLPKRGPDLPSFAHKA